MEQNKKKYQRKGISLKLLTWIITIFVFVFSSTLITSLILISFENNKVDQANNNYIAIKDASNDVQMASDYLTNEVRLFVANADKKYMDYYFEEANVTKRREKAIDSVHMLAEQTSRHEEIHYNITKAVEESMDLMNLEYYAMKLVCVDQGISYADYPEVAEADISMVDPANRRAEALNAVLGSKYVEQKDRISGYITAAFEVTDELISANSKAASSNLRSLTIIQSIVITINIIFVVVIVLILLIQIIRPMEAAFRAIEANEEVHAYGNRELNYIVDAYNDVRSQNEKVKEKLAYEAEHDKLTNIYNRTGYVALYRRMRLDSTFYILVDVDGFKKINDEHGHDIGDKVLVRIAQVLTKFFNEDNAYVFRIGGDEFAVLVEDDDIAIGKVLIDKCNKVNEELLIPKGRIPSISLSIGIARGNDEDTTDTLFKKADTALYKVKQSGKSGVYYSED